MAEAGSKVASMILSAVERCPLLVYPSSSMCLLLVGYLSFLIIAELVLPGKRILGVILPDNTRIVYRCTGFSSTILLLALLGIGAKFLGLPLTVSWWLLASGYTSKSKTSSLKPHVTGSILHDWWFGVQLNPQLLGLDFKFFWIRAGMMGWLLINLSIAAQQIQLHGNLSLSMLLYQSFVAIYVLDYFWFEEYMTSTWDIIAEKFGFMLVFGDLVWIPFTFSIQGWWLLKHTVDLTVFAAILNIIVFIFGYTIFRGSNRQKHLFKKDPKALIWGQPAKTIGGKLLVSGYWGIARHCNYLGDLLLALSFSLPCGTISMVPYFYPIYLLVLLIWRERRDEAKCKEKYKGVWMEYCKVVHWRIFPGIY
ncbi:hypothetical protein O6H91_18G053900 [Diphasiastrum complanatum]|uniref:Uncharacterized protein n=1 Tax=Diphasiastrum complanatum TaxID=34168 RepID=A0ACC2B1B9_DIPCM|nr:hypothetical protein O6H91_18G053900 [Diphasiastrum complanatum]